MAIYSAQAIFSDDQAITADAASTNLLDLGAPGTVYGGAAAITRDIGPGQPIPITLKITEVFDNLTSLDISIQVDDNSSFSSAKTVFTQNMLLAALTAGATINLLHLPNGVDERYLRLYYDVNGTNPSTGKIWAAITLGNQTA